MVAPSSRSPILTRRIAPEMIGNNDTCKYISQLMRPESPEDGGADPSVGYLIATIQNQPIEVTKQLQSILTNVFKESYTNFKRLSIINHLLCVSQDQWPLILEQASLIVPNDEEGLYLNHTLSVLKRIESLIYREQLITTSLNLFKEDHTLKDRYLITFTLSKFHLQDFHTLSLDELSSRVEEIRADTEQVDLENISSPQLPGRTGSPYLVFA